MKKIIKSFFSVFIDSLISLSLLVGCFSLSYLFPKNSIESLVVSVLGIVFCFCCLLFSNVFNRSIGFTLFSLSLSSKNFFKLRVFFSNLLCNVITFGYFYITVEESSSFWFYVFTILFIIEYFSCIIPNVGSRMSLFLFGIKVSERGKNTKKRKRNDGIIL